MTTPAPQHCAHECVMHCAYIVLLHHDFPPCGGNITPNCQYDTRSKSAAIADPCEENGCTDTENCDEICDHQRIYSPSEVREKIAAAIAEHDKRPRPPCECCIWQNSTFQPAKLACQFDLQAYSKGETFFEDIRACSGESCNYCGRYTSQHDARVRTEVLKEFAGFIDAYSRQDEDGHDYVSVLALQNHIDYLRDKK